MIDQLTADFDPTQFHDTYRQRLEDAIETKIQGKDVQFAEEKEPAKVTDLMEALQASVEAIRKRSA